METQREVGRLIRLCQHVAGLVKAGVGGVRQWYFPRPFRIGRPQEWACGALLELEKTLSSEKPSTTVGAASAGDIALAPSTVGAVATVLWLLHRELKRRAQGRSQPDPLVGQITDVLEILLQQEIEVQDHTDQVVPPHGNFGLDVLCYEPCAELTEYRVLETIRPTVRFRKKVIQRGKVIVGVPEKGTSLFSQSGTT